MVDRANANQEECAMQLVDTRKLKIYECTLNNEVRVKGPIYFLYAINDF